MESTEDIGPEAFANVTTLYPVANQNTNIKTKNENDINENNANNENNTDNDNNTNNKNNKNNENNMDTKKDKPLATSWKIEAAFAESNLDKNDTTTVAPEVEQKNETKEFKPSQHLGSFFDADYVAPTGATFVNFTPVVKKPASGFLR